MNFGLKHSFAARVSGYIIGLILVIFCAIMILFYKVAQEKIIADSMRYADSMMTGMSQKIDAQLQSVALCIESTAWVAEANINHPDLLKELLKNNVLNTHLIIGSALAYEPCMKAGQEQLKMIYAMETADGVALSDVDTEHYYYPGMDWYLIPKQLKQSYWSEPYSDQGAGNTMMVTYSRPLIDTQGNVYAIYTADISLLNFTDLVEKMQPLPDSYSFMLSRNGYYLTHHKKERIMHETVFSRAFMDNNKDYEQVGYAMIAGKSGSSILVEDTNRSYAIYTPISNIGWSICNVSQQDVLLADLNTVTRSIIIIFIAGIFCFFLFTALIIKRLMKPLEGFAASVKEVAHGNFEAQLPSIRSKDEMKELHDSFAYMQQSLRDYISKLQHTTASKERIESELNIAHDIQMGMLPRIFPPFPERKDVELYASLKPAKEVGGDLYDFFILDEKLYFTVGDVSGKGVPASLFMAVTRTLFRNISRCAGSSAEIVYQMNEAISEQNDSNMFVTLFVGILDLQSGVLDYCSAGHNPSMLISAKGEVTYLKSKQQLSVGIFSGTPYTNESIILSSDSCLFCYTDGVVEAENPQQELYGKARLFETLSAHHGEDVKTLTEQVLMSVADHVSAAEQSDDLTILVVSYKKSTSAPLVRSIEITNRIEQIERVAAFINELEEMLTLSPSLVMQLNLAIEEAVANVVMYAYPQGCTGTITLRVNYTHNELTFVLSDQGAAFDPTQVPEADITCAAEERKVGGLGIFLIRKIMDEVTYQRIDNQNILKMKKIIEVG